MTTAWIIVAAVGALLAAIALTRYARGLRPQMSGLPMTPLERLGWIGLGVTATVGAGMAALVAIVGVTGFQENGAARGIFTLLMLGGIAVWGGAWYVISRRRGGAVVDERDRSILARSLSVESIVVLLSLVAWTVTLTEVFWDEGAIPLGYLQLLFWSTFIGGAFGRSLGIVLGYRREITVDG
jgi:hypothetical protein